MPSWIVNFNLTLTEVEFVLKEMELDRFLHLIFFNSMQYKKVPNGEIDQNY